MEGSGPHPQGKAGGGFDGGRRGVGRLLHRDGGGRYSRRPSTLTGSIGIVGGKVVARRLLDMLGIHRETLSLHRRAGFRSPTRPFTSDKRAKLREHLRFFYEKLFVPRVAEGRGLSLEAVQEVARGRVWTGRQGKDRGLVDELGDLEDAVQLAREKAGISSKQKINVVTYAKRPRLRELLSVGVPWGARSSVSVPGLPASSFSTLLELVTPLISEEALFLMPWILRIRGDVPPDVEFGVAAAPWPA